MKNLMKSLIFKHPSLNRLILIISFCFFYGCMTSNIDVPAPPPPQQTQNQQTKYTDLRKHSYRTRNKIPTEKNLYEGSLWKDESSWGNLLRDHRARFKDDVITITRLQDIISVNEEPEKKATPTPLVPAGEAAAETANKVLEAATGMSKAEKEQREVLKSLQSITARVASVLPNGNMVIVGEKVDYKQLNTVRYVTQIKGIIRPEDVNHDNEVVAMKLARSEVQIKRQMLARNFNNLAPVIGKQKASFLDRLSHVATIPQSGATTTPVATTQ
ncbi:MAG: flagellar biosynthesis protein FlgH [Deltaproteobacteria bacterium]|nr:flagellar biosynthesis protein FlgH [Deltaproteobacteria bacterium]